MRVEFIELAGVMASLGSEAERTLEPPRDLFKRFRWDQVGQDAMTIRVRVFLPEKGDFVDVVRTIAPHPRNQCLMWLRPTEAGAVLSDCADAGPSEHGY